MRQTLAAVALTTLLAVPQFALAQSRTPAPHQATRAPTAKATVEIMVVHATNSSYVDPKLQKVMRNLKSTRYTGFKLLSEDTAKLAAGGDASVSMVGNRRLKVTLVDRTATAAKVRIRLFKESNKVLDTTMTIPNGKYVMIAGPNHKDGKLVIPVGVSL